MRDPSRNASSIISLRRAMTSSIVFGSTIPSSVKEPSRGRAAHALVHEPQAVERECEVYFVYELRRGRDERREPARRDDARPAPQLFNHTAQNAVHETGVPVIKPGLYGSDGRGADNVVRALDAYARQARGAREERVGRDGDARRDDAAEVSAALVYHLEVGRGAEVHDDARRAVLVRGRDGDDDSVRPHVG